MKRILVGIGVVFVVALLALMIVPFLIPSSVYKSRIEQAASDALGRTVQLNGDASISVFPRIGASVADVVIANPDGFADEHFVTAEALRASVKWLPLISRKIDVSTLEFVGANVSLERRADGVANWEFPSETPAEAPDPNAPPTEVNAAIDRARLVRSSVKFVDAVADINRTVSDINVTASLQSLDERASLKGDAVIDGLKTDFDIAIGSINGLMDGSPTEAAIKLGSNIFSVEYDGAVTNADAPVVDGRFSFSTADVDALLALGAIELEGYDTLNDLVGSISISGNVSGGPTALTLTNLAMKQSGQYTTASYDGSANLAEAISLDGRFSFASSDIDGLLKAAGIDDFEDQSFNELVGSLSVSGNAAGSPEALSLSSLVFKQSSKLSNASYNGDIAVGDAIALDGTFEVAASDLPALFDATNVSLDGMPDIDRALGTFKASGGISGSPDALALSNVSANHTSDVVTFSFDGDASLAGAPGLNGALAIRSDQLRTLAAALGADMSEQPDGIFQSFALQGDFKSDGTTSSSDNLSLAFDKMTFSGPVSLNLSGEVPQISANITTNSLDLTPYTGDASDAPQPAIASDGWSKEPLDLSVLKSVNGSINLSSPSIKSDEFAFTDIGVLNTLSNGTLATKIESLKSFDGSITGNVTIVGNAAPVPTRLTANLDATGISSAKLLGSLAGVDVLTGIGGLKLTNLSSSGTSVDELMRNLSGQVSTNLADGSIKGINVAQILRTASEALSSGTVPTQWSPAGETDFSSFTVDTTITNGVAQINPLKLLSPLVQMEATGTIDLGERKLNLKPKLSNANGNDIKVNIAGASFSVSSLPLVIGGSWSSVSGGVDSSYLQELAREKLRSSVRNEVGNQFGNVLGDDVGNVVGGLLGNQNQPAANDNTDEEDEAESKPEDVASELLQGIFGNNRNR